MSAERFIVEQGEYTFFEGASSEDIRQSRKINVSGEILPLRELSKCVYAKNYDGKYNTKMCYSKKLEQHYMQGGGLLYNRCVIGDAKHIELVCASNSNSGNITVGLNGKKLCEVLVKPTVDITKFDTVTAELCLDEIDSEKPGMLSISMPEQISLLSFKVY